MFHVRGRGGIFWPAAAAAATAALACFVCCMICVIRSSCCRVRPSFPFPVPAGDKLGEGVLEPPESTPPQGVEVRAVIWCCCPAELPVLLLELLLFWLLLLVEEEVRLL